jgi:hypothetical protein
MFSAMPAGGAQRIGRIRVEMHMRLGGPRNT